MEELPTGVDLTCELLQMVGSVYDPTTEMERFRLLEAGLKSDIPRVRYGAISGLSHMPTVETITLIQDALESEDVDMLSSMMEQLIDYIESQRKE